MKILYVTTVSGTVNAFLIPQIKLLVEQGHQVDVAFRITREPSPELINLGCKIHNVEFQRSPLKRANFIAYKTIKNLIIKEGYNIVHTHTPIASFLTRLACKKMPNLKIVYTAHGFHFFKGASLKNWLLYYPIERYLSRYTDILITINKEDYARANRTFKARSVEYIPGVGFDSQKFSSVDLDKVAKRKEIGIPEEAVVLLSVGEINKNKNHETIIRAMAKLNNPNVFYVICGEGALVNYLRSLSVKLGIEKQVKLLGIRRDIAEICAVSDIFAFPSKREGLGLAALEAMAAGLPIITSNVHGIVDYSVDGVSGYCCSPTDVDGFKNSLQNLILNKNLRKEMGRKNTEVAKRYDIKESISIMEKIFHNLGL